MTTIATDEPSHAAFPPLDYKSADAMRPRPAWRSYADLFLISFLILFFELACIRWFGSTVVFLTFFTNIVLMGVFLGMSVGCLAASRKRNFVTWVLPLAAISVMLAVATFWAYQKYGQHVTIDVGNQAKSPQLIYFGTEYRPADPSRFVVPLWAVAGVFFALISILFVGLGQVMGRAFDAIPNRIGAYTFNIFGSLVGIVAFFVASWFHTSPHTWFAICILLILYFVPRWTPLQIISQIIVLFIIAFTAYGVHEDGKISWSSYYKIRYKPETREIDTNNISHQQMLKISEAGPAYMLPHLLNHDAGGQPFGKVLIIGAGSGNDVEAALESGVGHVDAVEIDRVINELGKAHHPDRPFDDTSRVKVYYDDGRRFLKKDTGEKYDLIVYALVDSLVLHSGYSSLRLESFLFTKEAFADIKARLKPGGVFAMYNYYRMGWVVGRLNRMATDVFEAPPVVISMPFQETISAEHHEPGITFLLCGDAPGNKTIDAIRSKFEANGSFWLNDSPRRNRAINGFGSSPHDDDAGYHRIAPATVDTTDIGPLPTDNWPFLYLREKKIPTLSWQGMAVIGGISIVILLAFAPVRTIRPSGQMFFLGAGFMLLETKGVVHMALLFGSTWVVNSVVFFAILVMILLANLFVLLFKPQKMWSFYALLGVALLVNTLVPMSTFLALPGVWRTIVSCSVIFIPIFFAGVIFAAAFRDSKRPDVDFGSNIAGVILGGLTEYFSMMVGFNYLLLIAIGFYGLSMLLRRSTTSSIAVPAPSPAG